MTEPAILERGAVMSGSVTVLNADYEILHTVSLNHAIRMIVRGVAEVHEAADEFIGVFIRPVSVRLLKYVVTTWRYQRQPKWSKAGVLKRDRFECAFCGGKASTIDHIIPRSRGGKNTWKNTIAACSPCNNKKRDRTPQEASMTLRFAAKVPDWTDLYQKRM
jgi:5-methylcytosine-specific restriction endonuclease McrA